MFQATGVFPRFSFLHASSVCLRLQIRRDPLYYEVIHQSHFLGVNADPRSMELSA